MTKDSFIYQRYEALYDMCYIFVQEMKSTFKDEGVLLFFILLPLGYPLLYSWIYNNEVLHEVPTVVVDQSHSFMSREFIRKCDATSSVKIITIATSVDEARRMQSEQLCHGIVLIPEDFETKINRKEQSVVTFFADMSGMLYYKAIQQALTDVSLDMGKDIQISRLGNFTQRDDEVGTAPLAFDEVQMFNPQGGYASFLLPAVLILIIQQSMLLGIGLSAGTARETSRYRELIPIKRHYNGMFRIVLGKSLCYFLIYVVMSIYVLMVVPKLFDFVRLAHFRELIAIILPFLLACIFFGMTLSCMVRYRENVILLIVFTSVPMLFLSGVSWPGSAMSSYWKGISYLIPSTFGINAYVKIQSFGASLEDVKMEYRALWAQALIYFFTACGVYWRHIRLARRHAVERRKKMLTLHQQS